MATYKVGSDGKAQSGLSVGDEVVTAGGTYKITGVNSDGTYQSSLSNANQTTSNYTGSYASGSSSGSSSSGSSSSGNSAASSSGSSSSGTSSSSSSSSGVKVANTNVQADMSRNTAYAGQTVWKNGYAITYNDLGYAVKAVRSKSPYYAGHTDSNVAANGVTTDQNMWTDEQILTSEDLAKIAAIRAAGAAGTITWAEANAQANAIRSGYGYTIDQNGTVVDQNAVDRATSAQQATGATSYYDKTTGTYQPITSAPATNVGTVAGTTGATTGTTTGTTGTTTGSTGDRYVTESGFDYTDYIKDLYAAQQEAELAELEAAYIKNVSSLESAGEKIGTTYQAAKNQAAAQNELARQDMNEYFAARGLNTGTQGQMSLAQSAALQGQLGTLGAEEAEAITENQRDIDELEQQYILAQQQAKAQNNAELTKALYEEMARQDKAAAEQAKWEAQLALTQQQYSDSQASQARDNAYNLAMYMLELGVMPDTSTLAAAGITSDEALEMMYAVQQQYADSLAAKSKSSSSSSSSSSSGMTLTTAKAMMKAGQFTDEAVQTMLNAGFNAEYLASEYGYGESESAESGYDEVLADVQALRLAGESSATINSVIVQAKAAGMITNEEAIALRGAYVGSR